MDATERRRLKAAYLAAEYLVDDPRLRCELAVGLPCAALSEWLRQHDYNSAAFITAWNPRSAACREDANLSAQQKLRVAIDALGLPALEAVGRSPIEDYREPSLLVPGLRLEAAHALMRRFEQNAFLWCDAEGCPRLHWTR